MDRREQLQKATIDTAGVGPDALLPLEVGRRFLVQIKEQTALGSRMTQDIVTAPTGQLNKFNTSARIIRAAVENTDDGYRVGANFPVVQYSAVKVRLPWEVTEDAFHENIAGQGLEATITNDMTRQFALDIEDLEVNGDEASANAFVQINDGILVQLVADGLHRVNGGSINAGDLDKEHFFAAAKAMPNKYYNPESLVWLMSPARHLDWIETVTERLTAAGDSALISAGPPVDRPLGIPVLEVPSFPNNRIVLADPRNFHRVVSWQMRRRRVTGETDATLAALDKRFYVYFLKHDVIVEEHDAIVDVHSLAAI